MLLHLHLIYIPLLFALRLVDDRRDHQRESGDGYDIRKCDNREDSVIDVVEHDHVGESAPDLERTAEVRQIEFC